jgi:poly(A) polymerase
MRRDFTINGMFFDPIKEELFDFVEGKKDLKKKIIRAIGDPKLRFKEDRLRMVRAVRLSTRFGFAIEEKTKEAIRGLASELFPSVAIERIWQEFVKMDLFPHFKQGVETLFEMGLLTTIFPSLKNLSKKQLEERLSVLDLFPKEAPLIAKLLELFPTYSCTEQIELCHFLKLSNEEMDFVLLLDEAKKLIASEEKLVSWAHFYAKSKSHLALEIVASHFTSNERSLFDRENKQRKKTLEKAILRIQKKDPVVKAHHLKEAGISPGKEMGLLLKEAEKITIEQNLESPQEVLEKLRKTSLWP